MSEEILKALMELFALIVKQDFGVLQNERDFVSSFLIKQLSREGVTEYLALFDLHAGTVEVNAGREQPASPSLRDSVKILGICKKINRTLNQEQKVVVLMRLYELASSDQKFTVQRVNIINTVAEVFKISQAEVTTIEQFVRKDKKEDLVNPSIRFMVPGDEKCDICNKMATGYQDTKLVFLRVESVDLFFLKYYSSDQLFLNGLPIAAKQVYTIAKGSSIRSQHGYPIYYSDISSTFLAEKSVHPLSFSVENLLYRFTDGTIAVNNASFSVNEGNLVGILGASGSGKTTLLNLMSGILTPTSGTIKINGIDIFKNNKAIEGVLGYVPQDDLLVEDLTVFENLYFAACQCFGNKAREEIIALTDQTLVNLGLFEKRNLRVGSLLNKTISGGQRKRLNIALELIREPSVLFLDEPTSGLSSRDSETLMDLLRDLTLKGKLVITVLHQPSSEVFKMFDKVIILDQGGYMSYFGNPIESVIYFKKLDVQINSSVGECPSCGNVNPETIFNILETQIVDEFGRYTENRKVKPAEWASTFTAKHPFTADRRVLDPPHKNLERPSGFKQFLIYITRDYKSKIANRQYLLLTLLEAPVLGFILSFIIRYIPDPNSSDYIFFDNENIPIYIFMSLIVALFLGLTISAEEIFRDRKILKRERFLSLSRASYIYSKVAILIIISSIQVFLFLIIANPVLGIKGMFLKYYIALFTTAFCANLIGLNISASFNSAITIYIVIPLVIIPMMVLSGAMFSFDKLNRAIGRVDKVPVIAELIPTRWTYEALMVAQFKDNKYNQFRDTSAGKTVYDYNKQISIADYYSVKFVKELRAALDITDAEFQSRKQSVNSNQNSPKIKKTDYYGKFDLLRNELTKLTKKFEIKPFGNIDDLTPDRYDRTVYESLIKYISYVENSFRQFYDNVITDFDKFQVKHNYELSILMDNYSNEKLREIVIKYYEPGKNKILEYNNSFVQNYDPIYLDPQKNGLFGFRTHYFAPSKYFLGLNHDTFSFNILLVLLSTVILIIILYFNLLGRFVEFIENLRFRK